MNGYPRQLVNPLAVDCYALLLSIEDEYHVSIRFWIDLRKPVNGSVECWMYASGSGAIFDSMPNRDGVCASRILQTQNGNIYPALWTALSQLEFNFHKAGHGREVKPLP